MLVSYIFVQRNQISQAWKISHILFLYSSWKRVSIHCGKQTCFLESPSEWRKIIHLANLIKSRVYSFLQGFLVKSLTLKFKLCQLFSYMKISLAKKFYDTFYDFLWSQIFLLLEETKMGISTPIYQRNINFGIKFLVWEVPISNNVWGWKWYGNVKGFFLLD